METPDIAKVTHMSVSATKAKEEEEAVSAVVVFQDIPITR